jgi:hypothetical protein
MIIRYSALKKKPSILTGFAGVTATEFEELEAKAEPIWLEREMKRLERPDRQRAMGGGRSQTLRFREQLLMTLIWLRLYLVLEALGYLFGVDKSSASRYTNSLLPVLRQVGEETLGWSEPPKRGQSKNLDKVRQEHADLFAYVDATEQRIRRSSNYEQQKEDYSGKKNNKRAKPKSLSMKQVLSGTQATQVQVPNMIANCSAILEPLPKYPKKLLWVAIVATKAFRMIYPNIVSLRPLRNPNITP